MARTPPPLTEGKVSTGVRVRAKMMRLRNEVVPAEQRMCRWRGKG